MAVDRRGACSGSLSGKTVFLHIGTPKSGTTYLQSRFTVNRDLARTQGLLWPGSSWGRQVDAVRELRGIPDGEPLPLDGAWSDLLEEAKRWHGPSVLISMEWLSGLTPHQIRLVVESLSPARVEVVCTARDLLRTFVAQGQEMAKNYRPWSWAEFVDQVRNDDGGRAHRVFWRQQGLPDILRRWLAVIPAERTHLVTVPPAGSPPDLLWERFCSVVGIDGGDFAPPHSENASLGALSTVLMQRLNVAARARRVPADVYKRAIHQVIGVDLLAARRSAEPPIAVSDEMDEFLRKRAEVLVDEVQAFGVDLVGEWSDLVPGRRLTGRRPEEVTDAELLEVCTETLVDLAVSQSQEIDQLRAELRAVHQGQSRAPRRRRGFRTRQRRETSLG